MVALDSVLIASSFAASHLVPHEVMKANRFVGQLLDYCPGNTPKVSTWSRTYLLSGLVRDQTNGNYAPGAGIPRSVYEYTW
jgi:hypothetical protein